MSNITDIWQEPLGDFSKQISGISAAEATLEGARLQEELGREALGVTDEAQLRLEQTLAPFVDFGTNLIPEFQGLFQPSVSDSIASSPTLQAFNSLGSSAVQSNPFLAQLDPQMLNDAQLMTNIPLLSRERGDLLSALQLGQASAAQQAAGSLQTGSNRADLLSQIGNAQAAGGIGAANALGQGAANNAAIGTSIASFFANRNKDT